MRAAATAMSGASRNVKRVRIFSDLRPSRLSTALRNRGMVSAAIPAATSR